MTDSKSSKTLTVWRLMDGKIGHEKQSQALVEGLKEQHGDLKCIDIPITKSSFFFGLRWILNLEPFSQTGKPDFIIGAGHRTHIALLAAKRYYRSKAIVIMTPSLPYRLFDLIVAPQHDFINKKTPDNLISTFTALAPFVESKPDSQQGLILLGGENKHYVWDTSLVSQQIDKLTNSLPNNIKWLASNSRRTPQNSLATLQTAFENKPNITILDHNSLPREWLETQLKTAAYIIITADSASMIAEALNTKAHIYLVTLSKKNKINKLESMLSQLASRNLIFLDLNNTKETEDISRKPLNQQNLCAKIILESYL